MRIESSITSVSWIPSEAVTGVTKGAFETGFTHYDAAPPDDIGPDIARSWRHCGQRTASASPTISTPTLSSPPTARWSTPAIALVARSARPRSGSARASRWQR